MLAQQGLYALPLSLPSIHSSSSVGAHTWLLSILNMSLGDTVGTQEITAELNVLWIVVNKGDFLLKESSLLVSAESILFSFLFKSKSCLFFHDPD